MTPWIPDAPMLLPGPAEPLSAQVDVPASKSLTNRALIAAAAANGGRIVGALDCSDTRDLAGALAGCGWQIRWTDVVTVGPRVPVQGCPTVQLGNSGTGARLLLALLASVPCSAVVDGSSRLRERPMAPLVQALLGLGAKVRSAPGGFLPIEVIGRRLAGGELRVRPGVSSQFVSSLLLAAPLMERGLHLELDGEVPSRPYLDLTTDVLEAFGGRWKDSATGGFVVSGGGLRPTTFEVEGDWSAAAFFGAAAAVAGGRVDVATLRPDSAQGDRVLCEILANAGVDVTASGPRLSFIGPATLRVEADLRHCPDMFPALSVVAACREGSRLTGLEHLRHKESDRLASMVSNLERLGARFSVSQSCLEVVRGLEQRRLERAVDVTGADDHRIAMAMAVAALRVGPLSLDDPQCVAKSFPSFWECWRRLLPADSWTRDRAGRRS